MVLLTTPTGPSSAGTGSIVGALPKLKETSTPKLFALKNGRIKLLRTSVSIAKDEQKKLKRLQSKPTPKGKLKGAIQRRRLSRSIVDTKDNVSFWNREARSAKKQVGMLDAEIKRREPKSELRTRKVKLGE